MRDSLLLCLFDVAFRSRSSLPLLISVGFMLLDLNLRVEVEFEARAQRRAAARDPPDHPDQLEEVNNNNNQNN